VIAAEKRGDAMEELKSAFDIAMERAEKLGKASPEEIRKRDLVPQGEKLAARYLKGQCDLTVELSKYDDEARGYVAESVKKVLLRNLDVPKNEVVKRTTRRAMEGIKSLKDDKGGVENVYSKLRRLFKHYEDEGAQQRSQAYEELKQDFYRNLQQLAQQQGIPTGISIDVESHPQFQEQWRLTLTKLDAQYRTLMEEYKLEIERIT
jgi:hypothetical protein